MGKEREAAQKLGFDHKWVYVIGALQVAAIYLVYIQYFLPALLLVGGPFLTVAARAAVKKDYGATAVLIVITAMIAVRWLLFEGLV